MRLNNFSLMGLSINMRQVFWNVFKGISGLGYQSGRHTLIVLYIVPSPENFDWIKKNAGWTWIRSWFHNSIHLPLCDQPQNGTITSTVSQRQFYISLGCFCKILHSRCMYSKQQIHRPRMLKRRIVPAV